MKKIGIAGAGGIGSNVCMHLVRAGITNIKVVDYDLIDYSNLNRQNYFYNQVGKVKVEALKINMEKINPKLDLEIINTKINRLNINQIFSDCDIVIEAFDDKKYKQILIEELLPLKTLIVSASGIAGTNLDNVVVKSVGDNLYIVGDFVTDISKHATYSTKVGYIAARMANIVITYLEGVNEKI